MQTVITAPPTEGSWRTALLAGAAALTASNLAALTLSMRLAPLLRLGRTSRPRALPAFATGATVTGATAMGALAIGAVAVGALSVGALAIGALAVGRLHGGDWSVDRLRIRSLVVERWSGPDTPIPAAT
ncbi:hypothetical protein HPC49_43120 [Pyxidicoccus fallax]|uniref:Uncharacterized protein n=2 Tax=Pyxidicoccus fallax TaxID=394095 RepID=A0A848LH48_9BACT|nr:hypothetical protein [Pyxidicoccus fallax]NMO16955.1 hypothetical protein [Pyxidicoccus fallax]NPC84998.1 hypothetical protein [Pyxidicoccus fallax]